MGYARVSTDLQTTPDGQIDASMLPGASGVFEETTLLRRYIGMGARLILPGSDLNMMVRAATETAAAMRTCL